MARCPAHGHYVMAHCEHCSHEGMRVSAIIAEGHSTHCAKRQVWGDGCCECGRFRDAPTKGGDDA